ncbi:dual specificity protein phosphatase family protein [Uliginosibacterium flavum]|uniref:Tyrosine-protein phosphatase n=1 Tax=Uliginosibacterium flavum TaxID=1396831 RepID=A0ABV2TK70_9RHOO
MRAFTLIVLGLTLSLQTALAAPELRPEKWARPVIDTSVGNLFQVAPDLYRAEQPGKSDVADLKALGIKSFMNLREYHSDSADFEKQGFTRLRHAMAAGSVKSEDLVIVLRQINQAAKPVLVHCWHGSDRTGFVIAGYRLVFQGWSKAEAIDELRRGGFGYHERTYPNVKKTIEALDVEAIKRAVFEDKAASVR